MSLLIPVSVSPDGLRETIESMRLTVPSDSEDDYSDAWGEVLFCLDFVTMWAVRHTSYGDRVILQHLHALLL